MQIFMRRQSIEFGLSALNKVSNAGLEVYKQDGFPSLQFYRTNNAGSRLGLSRLAVFVILSFTIWLPRKSTHLHTRVKQYTQMDTRVEY